MTHETLVVTPWRRYGKNRLYVAQADGEKIGFWDLDANEAHPTTPELLPVLRAAVTHWQAGQAPHETDDAAVPAAKVPVEPELAVPSPMRQPEAAKPVEPTPVTDALAKAVEAPTWVDLALNKPGEAVREQAKLAKEQDGKVYTFIARVFDMKTDERAWRLGADGEERVGWVLDRLARKEPRWRFLHAVPVGSRDSDIDHVLIGPAGVYTVNTKHHPGARIWAAGKSFHVNGNSQPYIRNSIFEHERAAKLLSARCGFPVRVQSLIVLVGVERVAFGNKELPEDIHIMKREDLLTWLRRQQATLTDAGIEAIYEQARRSTTWHT